MILHTVFQVTKYIVPGDFCRNPYSTLKLIYTITLRLTEIIMELNAKFYSVCHRVANHDEASLILPLYVVWPILFFLTFYFIVMTWHWYRILQILAQI